MFLANKQKNSNIDFDLEYIGKKLSNINFLLIEEKLQQIMDMQSDILKLL